MSRIAMEKAIGNMPTSKQPYIMRKNFPQMCAQLLEVGTQLQDEIFGVLQICEMNSPSCLVVTPSRIVHVGANGSVEAWRYTDLKQIVFASGKKKLIGGHEDSFFVIKLANGQVVNLHLAGYQHDYNAPVATFAESACRKAQIAKL